MGVLNVAFKSLSKAARPALVACAAHRLIFQAYPRHCLVVMTLFWAGLIGAEPVLVLGGFNDKTHAATHLQRAEMRLNEQGFLSYDIVEGASYYRVVVPYSGRSIQALKEKALKAGFEGVWSWETNLASEKPPAAKRLVAKSDTPPRAEPQATTETSLARLATPTTVQARTPKRSSRFQTNISGYLKTYAVIQNSVANDFFNLNTIYQTQNSGRLMVETFGDDLVFQFHYELSPLSVSRLVGGDLQAYSIVGDNYRLSDLETTLTNDPSSKTQLYQNLDRLNVQLQLKAGDLTIGRQAIAFGAARFINPIDVFLPFDLRTFNTEYRTGVDAIRFQRPLGALGEIDVGLVLGANADLASSAAFVQVRNNINGKDFNFSLIEYAQQTLIGGGVQSELGDLGFWFETAYVDGDVDYVRLSTGLDYAFKEHIFGMIEYHYNGAGSQQPNTYLPLYETTPYQRGGVFLLGESYLIPSISLQVSPLLSLALQGILNLNDHSAYTSIAAEYNVADNFYMDFGVYVFSGAALTLSPDQTLRLGSEYGGNPNMFFSSLRWYF